MSLYIGSLCKAAPLDAEGPPTDQGCHNRRFWMKMSVRTSFSSGCPPASAFTRGRGFTRGRDKASAWTRVRPRGHPCLSGHSLASARMHLRPLPLPPSPPLPPLPPSPRLSARTRKIIIIIIIIKLNFFWYLLPAWKERKKFTIYNFRFSIPKIPKLPELRGLHEKPREEEGFFGLVPLVTHPNSIPLLGGLTPKFLSLSLHSL
jgi:hypothetical protein